MRDIFTASQYNETGKTTTMGNLTIQQYAESSLDKELNTNWYNTLSATAKTAIVPQIITQDAWYWSTSTASGNPTYSGTYGTSVPGTLNYSIGKYADTEITVGSRNIYALSVQDIVDYLSDENMRVDVTAILRNVNIWKMFWNTETQSDDYSNFWLRSACASQTGRVWAILGRPGDVGDSIGATESQHVRPAFNIDLSKISYSIV